MLSFSIFGPLRSLNTTKLSLMGQFVSKKRSHFLNFHEQAPETTVSKMNSK